MIKEGLYKKEENLTSFLMIGQSNMAGRGDLSLVEPIKNDLCFMYRIARWEPMCEPINVDKRSDAEYLPGVSLAASFADSFAKHTGSPVGLIPCASGGTSIDQWMPGTDLFDHAVFVTKLAMRTSKLGGILWHQGESDGYPFDKRTYEEKFLCIMSAFRRELNMPDLPIIIGELSEKIAEKWGVSKSVREINSLFHTFREKLPYCRVAKASDLELRCDGIHFSAASQRTLGIRYFEEYLSLMK